MAGQCARSCTRTSESTMAHTTAQTITLRNTLTCFTPGIAALPTTTVRACLQAILDARQVAAAPVPTHRDPTL